LPENADSTDIVEYVINILCNEQSNRACEYNAEEHIAMQSIQYSQTLKKRQ